MIVNYIATEVQMFLKSAIQKISFFQSFFLLLCESHDHVITRVIDYLKKNTNQAIVIVFKIKNN